VRSDFDVDGYEIEGLLGAGPTGETWLARDVASGGQVALHRLRPRGARSADQARRLVERLGALNHPHIRRIRELLPSEDELVFVLDNVEGGSMEQLLLIRGTLDPGELVTTTGTVARALAAAHERGLVHGALTPDTIHFTADGTPIVSDIGFGGLAAPEDASPSGSYSDPAEPVDSDPTPAGDVYSLAAISYAALTGLVPRAGEQPRPVHQVAPGVPPGLAHAIQAGLQPAWDMRPHMSQLGPLLEAASRPVPVRLAGGTPGPEGALPTEFGAHEDLPEPDHEPPAPELPARSESRPTESAAESMPASQSGADPAYPSAGIPPSAGLPSQGLDFPPPTGRPLPDSDFPPPAPPSPERGARRDGGEEPSRGAQREDAEAKQSARSDPPEPADGSGSGGSSLGAHPTATTELFDVEVGPSRSKPLVPIVAGVLLIVVAVVVAIIAWRASGGGPTAGGPDTPTSAPSPSLSVDQSDPLAVRWADTLAFFDERRTNAFAHREPDLLTELYAPKSQALAENEQYMKELADADVARVVGLTRPMSSLRTISTRGRAIVFEVVRQEMPYTVAMNDGSLARCPGGPKKTVRVEIVPLDGSTAWRISRESQVGGRTSPEVQVCEPSQPG
jgi:serine/threonine protein kinase